MSILGKIMDQTCEMFVWLDYQGVHLKNTIKVSYSTFSDLLKDINGTAKFTDPNTRQGYQSVQLQTAHGNFFLAPDRSTNDDDLVFVDVDGFEFSYKDQYVGELMEKIILRGNSD